MSRTPASGTGSCPPARRSPGSAAVVVLAGGSGTRVGGDLNKVYLPLAGRQLISWSFTWAGRVAAVEHLVLVFRPEDTDLAEQVARQQEPSGPSIELVAGGSSRHGSEQAALDRLASRIDGGEIDVVAIHDGARPLTGPGLFASVIDTAAAAGGAVPGMPALGMLPADLPSGTAADPGSTAAGPSGTAAGPSGTAAGPSGGNGTTAGLTRVQTPQAFRATELLRAYGRAREAGYEGTDTASSVERFSELTVRVVPGSRHNIKVTYPHDLLLAERVLAAHQFRMP